MNNALTNGNNIFNSLLDNLYNHIELKIKEELKVYEISSQTTDVHIPDNKSFSLSEIQDQFGFKAREMRQLINNGDIPYRTSLNSKKRPGKYFVLYKHFKELINE